MTLREAAERATRLSTFAACIDQGWTKALRAGYSPDNGPQATYDDAVAALKADLASTADALDRIEALEGALRWYAAEVEGCRKITSEGDTARNNLDRDGGKRARAALGDTTP